MKYETIMIQTLEALEGLNDICFEFIVLLANDDSVGSK